MASIISLRNLRDVYGTYAWKINIMKYRVYPRDSRKSSLILPPKEILFSKFYLLKWRTSTDNVSSSNVLFPTSSFQLYRFSTVFLPLAQLYFSKLSLWSRIPTGCTSNDKSSLRLTGGVSRTWEGSDIYFFNIEIWKTSWIRSKSRGNSKQ